MIINDSVIREAILRLYTINTVLRNIFYGKLPYFVRLIKLSQLVIMCINQTYIDRPSVL